MQTATFLSSAKLIATVALAAAAAGARAHDLPVAPPQNVLQLSAAGSIDATQDLLTISLSTSRDGMDAAAVQRQLTEAVDSALGQVKPAVQPGQLEVRTGRFGLAPRWTSQGRIDGWTGTAEILLEGRDFTRITQAASKVQTLTVHAVSFGLSREERERVEHEAQAAAVQRFRAKATELARSFGFAGYELREVTVSANDQGFVPMRMAASAAAPGAAAPVPVEPGKSTVRVTVSGSVQLR
jgi:predicted secreted protein